MKSKSAAFWTNQNGNHCGIAPRHCNTEKEEGSACKTPQSKEKCMGNGFNPTIPFIENYTKH